MHRASGMCVHVIGVFMCTGLWSVCACNRCIHVHRAVECVCACNRCIHVECVCM